MCCIIKEDLCYEKVGTKVQNTAIVLLLQIKLTFLLLILVRCPKWLFEKFNIWSSSAELSEAAEGIETICISHSLIGDHIKERTKIQQKRPKFAGPIYFHAEVYSEVILESVRKSNKKALPARFISTRKYIWRSF